MQAFIGCTHLSCMVRDMGDKITVIVPCYNREKYIRKCLDSLIMQDYPFSDVEIILVDDASTDHTVDILKEYESKYPENILIVTNESNCGYAGKMRNVGMEYATGDYITFVDSDDWVSEDYLSSLYNRIVETEADAVAASLVIVGDDGKELSSHVRENSVYEVTRTNDLRGLLIAEEQYAGVCGKIYRTDFLRQNNIMFSETLYISEDYYFSMQCFLKARIFCTWDKILYYYRKNENGLYFNERSIRSLSDTIQVQFDLYDLYNTRRDGIWDLVEWFFYAGALNARIRSERMGATALFLDKLTSIKKKFLEMVPGAKNNSFVLQQQNAVARSLYEELFGEPLYSIDDNTDKKTIDVVMPTGGSRGGVEYVIKSWTQSILSEKYNLRIFHVVQGGEDYLDGYEKQWSMAVDNPTDIKLDVKYCAECYSAFVQKMGAPDICIATWIPIVTTACNLVRDSLKLKYTLVSWLHSGIQVYKDLGWGGLEHLGFADYHFCLSNKTKEEITEVYPNAKTYVIGNPVEKPNISPAKLNARKLCFVGRIDIEKRLDVILKAIAQAKDSNWKLDVVGDGRLSDEMKGLAEDLGLSERVCFMGWQDDPWYQVRDAAILVVASDYEGFSITALEASSVGKTVITTPVNGCIDYIRPGENGYFYNNDDPKNLADILDYISDGVLPVCNTKLCMDSVVPYLKDNYFRTVDSILQSL